MYFGPGLMSELHAVPPGNPHFFFLDAANKGCHKPGMGFLPFIFAVLVLCLKSPKEESGWETSCEVAWSA